MNEYGYSGSSKALRVNETLEWYRELTEERFDCPLEDKVSREKKAIQLAVYLMEAIAMSVKDEVYPKIIDNEEFYTIQGVNDGTYREADLVFPSPIWPKTTYIKGDYYDRTDVWMGPYDVHSYSADNSKKRSGIWTNTINGPKPVYYWFYNEFADAVADKASSIGFMPNIRLTNQSVNKINYTSEPTESSPVTVLRFT